MQSLTAKPKRWIGVSCVDWDSPALVAAGFYPDDVPVEWHLTYYANMIMACVLSPQKWLNASAQEIADWCDQTQDNFWFYLLCESPEQLEQAKACAVLFSGKLAGLVVSSTSDDALAPSGLPMLSFGREVFCYDHEQLRLAKPALLHWLGSDAAQGHGLILMSSSTVAQVTDVQTLLDLLGVGQ